MPAADEREPWLPGWELDKILNETPYHYYPEECLWLRDMGCRLFGLGAIRSYEGLEVPERYRAGTSGNLAVEIARAAPGTCAFITTPQGGNKGELDPEQCVAVIETSWPDPEKGLPGIMYYMALEDFRPSSDATVMGRAFEAMDEMGEAEPNPVAAYAHFHRVISASDGQVEIPYPATIPSDWSAFDKALRRGWRRFNLIGHTSKPGEPKRPDAAIVLGRSMEEVARMIPMLITGS